MISMETSNNSKTNWRIKYHTEEERKQAERDKRKRYYERHKEDIRKKQAERYKQNRDKILEERKEMLEVYKQFKSGELE